MNSAILYLAQATLVFSVLYLVYRLVLSRLTFHNLNRYLLLSFLPASLLLPLTSDLLPSLSHEIVDIPFYDPILINELENFSPSAASTPTSPVNYWSILTALYALGVGFSLVKLLFNIRKLMLAKQRSAIHPKKGYQLIVSNHSQIFSFFNWIFIPKEKQDDYDEIILAHEKAHVQLKHSIDAVATELYMALFWFNPLVYLYRKSLKAVHEFQADNSVLSAQTKQSDYLQLLLQNLEIDTPKNIYSYFNYPILKRRIDMITKEKSNQYRKLQYLLLLPICAFFLFAFTQSNAEDNPLPESINVAEVNSQAPSMFPVKDKSTADISSYFGFRKDPGSQEEVLHGGIDIIAPTGTPVVAAANGTIAKASLKGDWGNLVVITHADGYQTWYAHLNDFTVEENHTVKKGDIIGHVGSTGRSISPHLHYEVKLHGERVDPIEYLTE